MCVGVCVWVCVCVCEREREREAKERFGQIRLIPTPRPIPPRPGINAAKLFNSDSVLNYG